MKYDATARQLELSTLIDLKAEMKDLFDWLPDAIPPAPRHPNTASSNKYCELYWIGVNHWLLRSDIDNENKLIDQINLTAAPRNISAVIISDTLAFFSLSGPQTEQLISILCPLDIHPTVFPNNAVSYTEAFGLKALLIRREKGFELAVDCSYTDMMRDVLTRAGANLE